MIQQTRGIVLHSFKYGESGMIARVLTQNLGLQSYLVQGMRKSKSRIKPNLFQPLTIVDLVVYHKNREGLQRIKEIRCSHPSQSITTDISKTSIAVFISEMLLNAFSRQEMNPEAFDFIFKAILKLESLQENMADFHIIFLLEMSRFLGFFPGKNFSSQNCYFNLREGLYQNGFDDPAHCLDREESNYFFQLSSANIADYHAMQIPAEVRKSLVHKTIDYYRFHMEGFRDVRSLKVLESVFN